MKKFILTTGLFLMSILSFSATITSTIGGGNWSSTSTWVGGTVPTASDNVIINSAVYVNGNYTCTNLTVNAGASLYNTYAYSPTLFVKGSVVNGGSILTNPSGFSFYLDIQGNLTNNGSWNINTTTLSGSANQIVSEASGFKLEGYLLMSDSIGDIVLGSDVTLSGNTWELNRTKIKTDGYKLIAISCTLKNGYIESNETLKLDKTSLNNLTFSGNYSLDGNVYSQDNNIFNGTLTVMDTLANQYAFNATIIIKGTLINNGSIINHPQGFSLSLNIDGDIKNNGIWKPYSTVITGTSNHTIQGLKGKMIEGYLSMSDSIGDLTLSGNVMLYGSSFNLNKTTLRTNGFLLHTKDYTLYNGTIISYDTLLLDNSVIGSLKFYGDYKLNGNIFSSTGTVMFDNCTIIDTLYNQYAVNNTILVNGNIINRGTIKTHPLGFSLSLDVKGNIINEGIWNVYTTQFIGTANQTIQQLKGKRFEGYFNSTDSIGDIILGSDVMFESNTWNMNNTKLLTNGHKLLSNNYTFANGKINSNDTSILDNSAILNMRFFGNYVLGGNILSQSGNVFNDNVTIIDTLFNKYASSNTILVNGNIINRGTIKNHPVGFTLSMDVKGNIINEGIWNLYTTQFIGTANQTIQQGKGKRFEGYFNSADSIGDIILGSDVMFESNTWNMNTTKLLTNGHKLLSNNYTFANGKINSNDTSILDNSVILNMRFFGNYVLGGNIFSQSGNVFNDNVTIIDTLFNKYASSNTILVNGNIINKGTIKNHPAGFTLSMDLKGNITNEGIWNVYTTQFIGNSNQTIQQTKGKRFEGYFNSTDSIGDIILGSNVNLESNIWDMNKSKIQTNGHNLISNNYTFKNGKIVSHDTLLLNNSYIESIQFFGNYKLNGNVYSQNNNIFNDTLTVLDTLANRYAWSNTILVNGDLINHGSIINHPAGFTLSLKVKGNITNNRFINIYNLYLIGTNRRNISGSNAMGINANIYVDDSISLTGDNLLPSIAFTANPKAWCTIEKGATITLNTISNPARILNYGRVTIAQTFDNSVANTLTFYEASVYEKAGVPITKLTIDQYGYQNHPTVSGAVNSWWRLRNFPQNYKDSMVWLKLNYKTDALNGNLEDSLKVFFSPNAGIEWRRITKGVSINKSLKTVTINNAPSYGHYILSATPIGILTFHPRVETVEPKIFGNKGKVTIYGFGAGFKTGMTVSINKGANIIFAEEVKITDKTGESFSANFTFGGIDTGYFDVTIYITGESPITLSKHFHVEQSTRPEPWALLNGRNKFLLNRWSTYYINFGNRANVNALGVPLVFAVNDVANLEIDFPDNHFYLPKVAYDSGYTLPVDSNFKLYYVTDSLTGYIGKKMRVYAFYIPEIEANSTQMVRVMVKLNTPAKLTMDLWVMDPFMENIPLQKATTPPEVAACITAAALKYTFDKAVGLIPGYACYKLIYKYVDPIGSITPKDIKPDKSTWGSWFWNTASWVSSGLKCAADFNPAWKTAQIVAAAGSAITGLVIDVGKNREANEGCWRKFKDKNKNKLDANGVYSFDPNEIAGPDGYGIDNYIGKGNLMNYRVYFENKDSATSPATDVVIHDTIDLKKLDYKTFSFGEIVIADSVYKIQAFAKEFTLLIDLYPRIASVVKVHGILDSAKGIITVAFNTLDRNTLDPNEDVDLGFLPPNKTKSVGQANFSYTVALKSTIKHNDVITNQASIYFDQNQPIKTNKYSNKIDIVAPTSSVNSLPIETTDSNFTVSWSGFDSDCGLNYYNIFVSDNDSTYKNWLANTSLTTAKYKGHVKHTYKFYSIALDSIGNTETYTGNPDATTKVVKTGNVSNIESFIKVYPNPSKGKLTIESNLNTGKIALRLYDPVGRLVAERNTTSNTIDWDLSHLQSQIYYLVIEANGQKINRTVVLMNE